MLYNYENKDEFDKIYLHDAVFEGFNYDYDKREISFSCKQKINFSGNRYRINNVNKIYNFRFQNVIYSKLQSCYFWGGGNSVDCIYCTEVPDDFTKLIKYVKDNEPHCFNLSYVDRGINYMAIELSINSGDVLIIMCESVEVSETDLNE